MEIKQVSKIILAVIVALVGSFCIADVSNVSKTTGFIIPSYIASEKHLDILREGIRKIRLYHDYPIVIINDHSPIDISALSRDFNNVTIELSLMKARGEMNPYLHYYVNKYFDTAIIIHDSMHLKKKLENIDKITDFKFIRYFTNHRLHWAFIPEPQTDYNKRFAIKNHDDLVFRLIEKIKDKNKSFYDFCKGIYYKKDEWIGCFGIQSIMSWNFLNELQAKTNVLDLMEFMKDRRDRMAMESIFALACLYVKDSNLEYLMDAYDGIYYDGIMVAGRLTTQNFEKISLCR